MISVNKVTIIGRLGKDPECRNTSGGSKVVSFSLATSESWKDKRSGERKETTEWHSVVIFNERICDFIGEYAKKGDMLYIEGKLQTRKWQDKDGNDRYTTEIVVPQFGGDAKLHSDKKDNDRDSRGSDRDDDRGSRSSRSSRGRNDRDEDKGSSKRQGSLADELDDDIPF